MGAACGRATEWTRIPDPVSVRSYLDPVGVLDPVSVSSRSDPDQRQFHIRLRLLRDTRVHYTDEPAGYL